MVDARRVRDDERGAGICLRLTDRLQHLILVGTHVDLGNVDIAVGHRHHAEILLLRLLARCGKLCNRSRRRGLRCLTARIGVNLGVKDHDVDVFTRSEHVVHTAVADVVCPAVAAEDPL